MGKAVQFGSDDARPILTTAWILTEVGDAMAEPVNRPAFLRLVSWLRSSSDVEIVPCSPELFDRGVERYAERPDKEWSLTDCISFRVMEA